MISQTPRLTTSNAARTSVISLDCQRSHVVVVELKRITHYNLELITCRLHHLTTGVGSQRKQITQATSNQITLTHCITFE